MADGEEDEYEAHLDHLQRSKDLKAKSWFGKCFFPTSPLKNMNLPQYIGKKHPLKMDDSSPWDWFQNFRNRRKRNPEEGRFFSALKSHGRNHAGIFVRRDFWGVLA